MSAKVLTEEMIDQKLAQVRPVELRYIDPMRLAQWTLETACQMVDGAVSPKTIQRAIESGDLEGFKAGAKVTVEPARFLTWFRRFRK